MDDNNVLIVWPITEAGSWGNLMVSVLLCQDVTPQAGCLVPLPAQMTIHAYLF